MDIPVTDPADSSLLNSCEVDFIDHFLERPLSSPLCLPSPPPPSTASIRRSREALRKMRWRKSLSMSQKEAIKRREREQKRRRFTRLSEKEKSAHRAKDRLRKARERHLESPEQKQERLARERLRKQHLRSRRKAINQSPIPTQQLHVQLPPKLSEPQQPPQPPQLAPWDIDVTQLFGINADDSSQPLDFVDDHFKYLHFDADHFAQGLFDDNLLQDQ